MIAAPGMLAGAGMQARARTPESIANCSKDSLREIRKLRDTVGNRYGIVQKNLLQLCKSLPYLYFHCLSVLNKTTIHKNYFPFLQAVLWMAVKHQDKVKNTKSRLIFSSSKTCFYFTMILESYPDMGQRNSGQWDRRDTRYGTWIHHQSLRSGFGI